MVTGFLPFIFDIQQWLLKIQSVKDNMDIHLPCKQFILLKHVHTCIYTWHAHHSFYSSMYIHVHTPTMQTTHSTQAFIHTPKCQNSFSVMMSPPYWNSSILLKYYLLYVKYSKNNYVGQRYGTNISTMRIVELLLDKPDSNCQDGQRCLKQDYCIKIKCIFEKTRNSAQWAITLTANAPLDTC